MTTHQPNLSPSVMAAVLNSGDREAVISWLQWHDNGNGVYTDEDSEREGLEPLTLDEARQTMLDQLDENSDEHLNLAPNLSPVDPEDE